MADVLRWVTLSMASGLFTIEQIELIRRLRNSGITKEQVVLAFEQLERLDVELGRTCESSRLMGNQTGLARIPPLPITHQGESLPSSSLEQNNHDNTNNSSSLGIMITKIVSMPGSQSNTPSSGANPLAAKSDAYVPSTATAPSFKQHGDQSQSFSRPQSSSACSSSSDGVTDNGTAQNGDASPPASSSLASPTSRLPSELTIIPLPTSSSSSAAVFHSGNENATNFQQQQQQQQLFPARGNNSSADSTACVPVQCLVNPHDLLQDECVELEDLKNLQAHQTDPHYFGDPFHKIFKYPSHYEDESVLASFTRKGDAAILSEIRNFVMRYNIKQTMIAEMTRLSQAYVSRFFRGDIQDMSERTKNTFYMWYLTCKNNPWKLAHLCPNSGVKRMVSETGDLIPLKRERFTFKAAHLAVLERYYEKDPYPDAQTREQIVEECNKAVERPVMQHDGGRDVGLGHLSWPRERPLAEREKVTLPVVNNWFNNRRKEAKKQLRQQHAAAMAAAAIAVGGLSSQGLPQASLPSMPANCWPSSPSTTNSMTSSSMPSAFPSLPPPMSQTDLSGEATESDASGDSGGPYGPEEMMSIELEEEGKPPNCIKEELR